METRGRAAKPCLPPDLFLFFAAGQKLIQQIAH